MLQISSQTNSWCNYICATVISPTISVCHRLLQISSQIKSWRHDICATVFSPTITLVPVTECFKYQVRLKVGAMTFVLLSLVQPIASVKMFQISSQTNSRCNYICATVISPTMLLCYHFFFEPMILPL